VPYYEQAAKADPLNAMPHLYLGYAYKERGEKARARQEFKVYLKERPDADDRKDVEREIEDLGE
jgi:cytochrome c-type biogenesis protein CcmH/NrfG